MISEAVSALTLNEVINKIADKPTINAKRDKIIRQNRLHIDFKIFINQYLHDLVAHHDARISLFLSLVCIFHQPAIYQ